MTPNKKGTGRAQGNVLLLQPPSFLYSFFRVYKVSALLMRAQKSPAGSEMYRSQAMDFHRPMALMSAGPIFMLYSSEAPPRRREWAL